MEENVKRHDIKNIKRFFSGLLLGLATLFVFLIVFFIDFFQCFFRYCDRHVKRWQSRFVAGVVFPRENINNGRMVAFLLIQFA